MTRRSGFALVQGVLLVICSLLISCGSSPEPVTTEGPTRETMDWVDLDGQLPKWLLFGYNRWFGDFDADPAGQYRRHAAFDAPWDSLGTAAMAALPAADREWRRAEADRLVKQAFLAVSDRGSRLSFDRLAQRASSGPLHLLDRVMLRALSRLHTAVGTDPTSAAAWYHLAWFSEVVGDIETAAAARARFLELVEPPDPRRTRLILDEAWHLRDTGRFETAALWLDGHAAEFGRFPISDHALTSAHEADLIRALCRAELGDRNGVRLLLKKMPPIRVRDAHGWRDSDVLRSWVNGWAELRSGYPDLAAFHLDYRRGMILPAGIAWRFWQDMGLMCEELDRLRSAETYWGLAYLSRPYLGFYPLLPLHGTDGVMGQPATGEPYFLAFRTFFTGGSLWGYAATRVLACQLREDADDPLLWRQTFASLDACVRRGIHEPEARLLRARLNLQRGDWRAATEDLQCVAADQLTGSRAEADLAFLRGVALLNADRLAESIEPLSLCVALEPEHARGWQALAIAYSYLGHAQDAFAAYDRVEQIQPRDGVNYFNRGLLNLQHGRRDAAEADLVQAARLLEHNEQAIALLQAVASGREVKVDSAPQPVKLVASDGERSMASELDRLLSGEDLPPELQEMIADTPEKRAMWLDLLEQRHRAEPTAAHRAQLAEARAGAGDQAAVVALLESAWPLDLSPRERALLLDADRALGLADRAAAIAAGEVPAAVLDVPVLVRATTILLDHGRTDAARRVFARAQALAPDEPALRDLGARLP